jgi:hypothetical protein
MEAGGALGRALKGNEGRPTNAEAFTHDVFLSYSSKDKRGVRALAERLRKDGLRVWFDDWVLKPGDSIPAKIEEGLERSRVLVFCMSANAFGSDWAQLEAGTFRFRDPLNRDRRFIPLRLDDAPITGSLSQFLYIVWRAAGREQEYSRLLDACREPDTWPPVEDSLCGRFRQVARQHDDDVIAEYVQASAERLPVDASHLPASRLQQGTSSLALTQTAASPCDFLCGASPGAMASANGLGSEAAGGGVRRPQFAQASPESHLPPPVP